MSEDVVSRTRKARRPQLRTWMVTLFTDSSGSQLERPLELGPLTRRAAMSIATRNLLAGRIVRLSLAPARLMEADAANV